LRIIRPTAAKVIAQIDFDAEFVRPLRNRLYQLFTQDRYDAGLAPSATSLRPLMRAGLHDDIMNRSFHGFWQVRKEIKQTYMICGGIYYCALRCFSPNEVKRIWRLEPTLGETALELWNQPPSCLSPSGVPTSAKSSTASNGAKERVPMKAPRKGSRPPLTWTGGTLRELPTLLPFSFLPSRLLAST
jgi:hypothetical protein